MEKTDPSFPALSRGLGPGFKKEGLVVNGNRASVHRTYQSGGYSRGSPVIGLSISGGFFPPDWKSNMFVSGPASAS